MLVGDNEELFHRNERLVIAKFKGEYWSFGISIKSVDDISNQSQIIIPWKFAEDIK